ncbi:hypothetical protein GBF38_013564, partial [Nibea albiflora]
MKQTQRGTAEDPSKTHYNLVYVTKSLLFLQG